MLRFNPKTMKSAKDHAGMKNADIAKLWAVSLNTVSNKFSGKTPTSIEEGLRLANFLGIPFEYFFEKQVGVNANYRNEKENNVGA